MERGEYPLEKRDEVEDHIDEDDNSADEAYERSKEEERYFTKAYGHYED